MRASRRMGRRGRIGRRTGVTSWHRRIADDSDSNGDSLDVDGSRREASTSSCSSDDQRGAILPGAIDRAEDHPDPDDAAALVSSHDRDLPAVDRRVAGVAGDRDEEVAHITPRDMTSTGHARSSFQGWPSLRGWQ